MKKTLFIAFAFFLLLVSLASLVVALEIENFYPDPIQLVYGEKNFTFVLDPEGQEVGSIEAICITPFECSITCLRYINQPETCNGTLKVPQYTYAGMYSGFVNVSGETNIGTVYAEKNFTIIVEPYPSLAINFDVEDMQANDFKEFFIDIKNNGNIDLEIELNGYVEKDDEVYDKINIQLNETHFSLQPNQSKIIKANITSEKAKVGKYYAVIKAKAVNVNINFTQKKEFEVTFAYCKINSTHDYLEVEIKNKDDIEGKKFYPYDELKLDIKINNGDDEDHYVIVEAALVKDDIIEESEVSKKIKVDEDSYKRITLTINIPLLETDTYYVYVRVYDDDNEDECVEDNTYLNITRPTRMVKLVKVVIDKEYYQCGESMIVSGSVVNIGKKDEDLVKIVYKDDLQNEMETKFSLDVDEERNFLFNVEIPKNASEGMHEFLIYVYYNYDEYSNTFDEFFTSVYRFNISGNCIKPEKDGEIIIDLPASMYENSSYDGYIVIKNTGDLPTIYRLEVIADWATVNLETSLISLEPKEEKKIKISITPSSTGKNILIVKIIFDGKEKTASKEIEVKKYGEEYRKASWLDELVFEFERRPWLFILVIASLLISIVCLILLIIALSRKK